MVEEFSRFIVNVYLRYFSIDLTIVLCDYIMICVFPNNPGKLESFFLNWIIIERKGMKLCNVIFSFMLSLRSSFLNLNNILSAKIDILLSL